jgi:hypothetical protein
MVEFRDRFEPGVDLMMEVIKDSIHEDADVQWIKIDSREQIDGIDGIRQLVNDYNDSKVVVVYYQLYVLKEAMENIDNSISSDEMTDILSEIDEAHRRLKRNIEDRDGFGLELYKEIRNKSDGDPIDDDYMVDEYALVDEADQFKDWLRPELDEEGIEIDDPHERVQADVELIGGRLQYINTMLKVSGPLLGEMKDIAGQGLIGSDQLIGWTIRLSVAFSFVSIVLPLTFILTFPSITLPDFLAEWLDSHVDPGWAIFSVELLILASAVATATPLVEIPLRRMTGGSDTSNLSIVSRGVIACVDGGFSFVSRVLSLLRDLCSSLKEKHDEIVIVSESGGDDE